MTAGSFRVADDTKIPIKKRKREKPKILRYFVRKFQLLTTMKKIHIFHEMVTFKER